MSKSSYFNGQPLFVQLIKYLDKSEVNRISREMGAERYVKSFDGWSHLVVMLYAVISRFDSLREITTGLTAEYNKLNHLGIRTLPRRSTLADANTRRNEAFFAKIYKDLYTSTRDKLSADSSKKLMPQWMKRLQIMDSTTISLFSNLIFKGVGRNPKTGKKKGGIKVHTILHAIEGVPCGIRYTSAATHDSFMLSPTQWNKNDILAIDRAYIDYAKFEELTQRGVIYVTKMKKNLVYQTKSNVYMMNEKGEMVYNVKKVVFTKELKNEEKIEHKARIISYVDIDKKKIISLLTNDIDGNLQPEDIIAIYKKRWAIESLFKQLKQNFPLKYFYGESENAIKIQIWITLIANLLITLMRQSISRGWSFSGLATMIRIMLMYYVDAAAFFEHPEKDWEIFLASLKDKPIEPTLFE